MAGEGQPDGRDRIPADQGRTHGLQVTLKNPAHVRSQGYHPILVSFAVPDHRQVQPFRNAQARILEHHPIPVARATRLLRRERNGAAFHYLGRLKLKRPVTPDPLFLGQVPHQSSQRGERLFVRPARQNGYADFVTDQQSVRTTGFSASLFWWPFPRKVEH